MRIVIKPLGAFLLVGVVAVLAVLIIRNLTNGKTARQGKSVLPVAVPSLGAKVVSAKTSPSAAVPATPGPPAMRSARGHAIYRDAQENGWQAEGWSWVKEYSIKDKTFVRSGSHSIRVRYSGYDGLKFHHDVPLDTTAFDRITFYAHGGKEGGQHLWVAGTSSEETNDVGLGGVVLDPLPAGEWVAVTVPLKELGLIKPQMTSFWIQGGSGDPQPPVYIDEVRLLLPSEPAPSGRRQGYHLKQ